MHELQGGTIVPNRHFTGLATNLGHQYQAFCRFFLFGNFQDIILWLPAIEDQAIEDRNLVGIRRLPPPRALKARMPLSPEAADTVRAARPDAGEQELAAMRTAAPFTASRALELHMIDGIGYLRDAFQAATGLAGVEQARLVAYRRGSAEGAGPYSLASVDGMLEGAGARLLFLEFREDRHGVHHLGGSLYSRQLTG